MRDLNYIDLASRYEVELCADSCGQPGHRRGWVDRQATVHWDPHREVTRAGLRRFLMLVAQSQIEGSDVPRKPLYMQRPAAVRNALRIYNANVFAYRTALHDLGIRLPASLSRTDRAQVRSMLSQAPDGLKRSSAGRWAGLR